MEEVVRLLLEARRALATASPGGAPESWDGFRLPRPRDWDRPTAPDDVGGPHIDALRALLGTLAGLPVPILEAFVRADRTAIQPSRAWQVEVLSSTTSLAFHPHLDWLAIDDTSRPMLVDPVDGRRGNHTATGHRGSAYLGLVGIAWSPDGRRIASASSDGICIWTFDGRAFGKRTAVRIKADLTGGPWWSPDGQRISGRDRSWSLCIWDAATGKPLPGPDLGCVELLDWSADGRLLAVGWGRFSDVPPSERVVSVFDTSDWTHVDTLDAGVPKSLAWSPTGALAVVWVGAGGTVYRDGSVVHTFARDDAPEPIPLDRSPEPDPGLSIEEILSDERPWDDADIPLAWSRDGRFLAVGSPACITVFDEQGPATRLAVRGRVKNLAWGRDRLAALMGTHETWDTTELALWEMPAPVGGGG